MDVSKGDIRMGIDGMLRLAGKEKTGGNLGNHPEQVPIIVALAAFPRRLL